MGSSGTLYWNNASRRGKEGDRRVVEEEAVRPPDHTLGQHGGVGQHGRLIYIYIYIYIEREREIYTYICIYIYIYIYIERDVCVYIYIYIYI